MGGAHKSYVNFHAEKTTPVYLLGKKCPAYLLDAKNKKCPFTCHSTISRRFFQVLQHKIIKSVGVILYAAEIMREEKRRRITAA